MADHANKKLKPQTEIKDVLPPKKVDTAGDPQVIINSRPMLGRSAAAHNTEDEDPKPESAAATSHLTATKHPVLAPLKKSAETTAPTPQTAAEQPGVSSEAEEKSSSPAEAAPETSSPPAAAHAEEGASAELQADASEVTTDEADGTLADDSDAATKQPSAETRKAVEEAERAAKRQAELEKYIDSKEFFVPIDSVARKRSIQVSALLTLLVLILGFILIDLMLDSGIILLVQKIPHTHFFTSG